MAKASSRTDPRLVISTIVLAAAIFVLDLAIPLGVAGGVPYVAVVLLCVWSPQRQFTLSVAVACSLLTILGLFFSPARGILWMVLFNRCLALFAIWVTAILSLYFKRAVEAVCQSEEALRFERDNLINILETMEDGVYITNADYDLQFVNSVLKKEHGPYRGRKCYEYFGNREEICPWCKNQEIISGKTVRWEWYCPKSRKTYDLIDTPLRNSDGSLSKLEIFHDVTERKWAEAEREKLIAHLEAQNTELEGFAYTVSHDLKAPLITLKGHLGLLKKDVVRGDADAIGADVSRMDNAADKMRQLLDELLQLSRVGRVINPPENVVLRDLAHEATELLHSQIDSGGIEVEISADLPTVLGDRARLLEVLQNLIGNAVKYVGNQPQPKIEIGARRRNGQTVCYVRDNGIGIDPRYHKKIFGMFDQLDPRVEGSGLGLALVKRIVEVHGGKVWVESNGSGSGSTFYFSMPSDTKSVGREEKGRHAAQR